MLALMALSWAMKKDKRCFQKVENLFADQVYGSSNLSLSLHVSLSLSLSLEEDRLSLSLSLSLSQA